MRYFSSTIFLISSTALFTRSRLSLPRVSLGTDSNSSAVIIRIGGTTNVADGVDCWVSFLWGRCASLFFLVVLVSILARTFGLICVGLASTVLGSALFV